MRINQVQQKSTTARLADVLAHWLYIILEFVFDAFELS